MCKTCEAQGTADSWISGNFVRASRNNSTSTSKQHRYLLDGSTARIIVGDSILEALANKSSIRDRVREDIALHTKDVGCEGSSGSEVLSSVVRVVRCCWHSWTDDRTLQNIRLRLL